LPAASNISDDNRPTLPALSTVTTLFAASTGAGGVPTSVTAAAPATTATIDLALVPMAPTVRRRGRRRHRPAGGVCG
jgi:hypothetical protein